MNKKRRIGLLTIVIFIAGLIMTVIDAVVTVTYGVIPTEPSTNFFELVINGPLWWKINPIIIITILGVGITSFVLGDDTRSSKDLFAFVPVILSFVTISLSGLGDLMSQTFLELLSGNYPLNWVQYEWWWTMYMPVPALVAALSGHSIPSGTDMIIGSFVGIVILCLIWLRYYEKISFKGIQSLVSNR